jgi:polygalacturonase
MNAKSTILLALPLFCLLAIRVQTPIQAQTPIRAQATILPPPTIRDISWYTANCPFPMQAPLLPVFPDRDFPLTDYGAISDGHTLNTLAFQKAVHACSDAGGGRVVVPAGQWLTGPIELLSHVNLYLAPNAKVSFTSDHTQFPLITGHGYSVSVTPPIYGHDLEDIAITGEGSFDGAGDSWRPVKKEKMTPAQWSALLSSGGSLSGDGKIWFPSRDYLLRPCLLYLVNCRHILIRGILLANSPKFVFYPNHCSDLTMDHVRIFNEWWAQNGDGIDISACKNVLLYQCTVNAGDDGICMKSSGAPNSSGALPDGPALRNVIIAGCTVYRAHGGFVIGSNTDGGMHDIFVSDCNFVGTDVGLRFKSNMGRGGLVDDIFITGITMQNIVHEAVLFDTYYENVEAGAEKDPNKPRPEDKTPEFRDFHISRIVCNGAHTGISITGLPQMPVSRIYFDSMDIHSDKGFVATQAREIDLHAMKWVVQNEPVYDADKTAEIRIRQ